MPEHEHDPDRTEVHTGARAAAETDTIAIPGYRIERRLGEGGMGAVYLAEEIALSRRVAIKVVSDRIARDAEVRARFLREARLLATVEHPNVVRVYTFGSVEDRPYLVMEYVEGETLAERIQRTGPMPIDDALHILREIIDALAGAWEKQVIHRDIKPSNVLFDKRGRLKVADFGLAKGVASSDRESSLTQTGYLLGSPHYVAPEQAQGHDSDFRADIYSLGIVLFEMVTGRKPFEAASALAVVAKHLHDELPSARSMRKDVPDHIETLIRWMTDKDPNRRPRSYEELSAATNATAVGSARPRAAVPTQKRVVFALAAIVIAGWLAWARLSGDKTRIADNADDARIVIAVAPFYGPDPDSAREGRVMASLVA
ncbi:MAG TPA: serine/threonine-protein kinase, partial [Thermoanaerobaculia bacterium]|nr:serine/threonine-protein kinase [Thermoanaerobaculia bacterium]